MAKQRFAALPTPPSGRPSPEPGERDGRQRLDGAFTIELRRIRPDPDQPRRALDSDAQRALVASIRRLGVLQPIAVRYVPAADIYQVISGERRFQACQAAGLPAIPCWIQSPRDEEVLLRQIVENWQRADLNPYELADSLVRLRDANHYTQRDLARETGKPESEISRLLALQRVDPEVQKIAREETAQPFSKRHLYAISQLAEPSQQRAVATAVKERRLTAEQTEREVAARKPTADGARKRGSAWARFRYATTQAAVTLTFRRRKVTPAEILAALDEVRDKIRPSDSDARH
jgi:ParB family chromosome partitioning protein